MADGRTRRAAVAAAIGLLGWVVAAGAAQAETIKRESFQAPGSPSSALGAAISADGRYVTWIGVGRGGGGNAGFVGIYWKNRITGVNGYVVAPGQLWPSVPSISADGRYIAYAAANVVPQGYPQGTGGSYVLCSIMRFDRVTGTSLWLKQIMPGGVVPYVRHCYQEAVRLSADGRYVAFASYRDDLVPGAGGGDSQVYRIEVATGRLDLVSATPSGAGGNGSSHDPAISADGRYVAFASDATNLLGSVRGVPARGVYRADMGGPRGGPFAQGRGMLLASVDPAGKAFPDAGHPSQYGTGEQARFVAISDDGARVAFVTGADYNASKSAWRTYARDLAAFPAPTTVQVVPQGYSPMPPTTGVAPAALSGNGRYLACQVGLTSPPHPFFFYAVVDLATGQTVWGDPNVKSDDDYVSANNIPAASFTTDGSVLAFQSFGNLINPPNPGPNYSTDLYTLTLP